MHSAAWRARQKGAAGGGQAGPSSHAAAGRSWTVLEPGVHGDGWSEGVPISTRCEVCRSRLGEDKMVICDHALGKDGHACDKGYHIGCLTSWADASTR